VVSNPLSSPSIVSNSSTARRYVRITSPRLFNGMSIATLCPFNRTRSSAPASIPTASRISRGVSNAVSTSSTSPPGSTRTRTSLEEFTSICSAFESHVDPTGFTSSPSASSIPADRNAPSTVKACVRMVNASPFTLACNVRPISRYPATRPATGRLSNRRIFQFGFMIGILTENNARSHCLARLDRYPGGSQSGRFN